MYRVGFPFWKRVARAGLPVSFRVDVAHDHEANVYIATSPDLRGLVVEASSVEELVRETNSAVEMLMEEYVHGEAPSATAQFQFERGAIPV
jgi:hypothetical protein